MKIEKSASSLKKITWYRTVKAQSIDKFAMRKKTTYEWDIEVVDEYGDIQDNETSVMLNGFSTEKISSAIESGTLVLVKNTWIDYGDGENGELYGKAWAYVSERNLPIEFDDGSKVPAKFINEFRSVVSML